MLMVLVQQEEDRMLYGKMKSPIGDLTLVGSGDQLEMIGFPEGKGVIRVQPEWRREDSAFGNVVEQIDDYFAGDRKTFELSLKPSGTEFQLEVLKALTAIPYGQTVSYKEIARAIGRPKAVRAVGAANGRNPLPIVIPCHRVIGSDGSLTGFGGGIEAKLYLLGLESRDVHHSSP